MRISMALACSIGVLPACRVDRTSDAAGEASSTVDLGASGPPEPDYEEPEFVPKRTIRIGPDDVQPIPELHATLTKRTFTDHAPGPPRVLFEGKHLRLAHPGPLARNRGIVDVVTDGTDNPELVESRLVDFERGSIVTLTEVFEGIYPKFGVARGAATIDGRVQEVLLYAIDGTMLAWQRTEFADAHLYINPGLGDAWVFVNDDDDANTRYSHWTDLRKPPPSPTMELPFRFDWSEESGDRIRGPAIREPDAIPTTIHRGGDAEKCPDVLLHADGTFGCLPPSYHVMADGWRRDPRLDGPRFANVETGDLVVLDDVVPECDGPQSVTPDPPRAYYALCTDQRGVDFIWSPTKTVRTPPREPSDRILAWTKSHHLLSFGMIPILDGPPAPVMWLDMVAQQIVYSDPVYNIAPERYDRYVLYTNGKNGRELFLLSMATAGVDVVNAGGCVGYRALALSEHLLAFACLGRNRAIRWTAVIDPERRLRWRLPAVQDIWLQHDPLLAVGIESRRGKDRVVAWSLTSSEGGRAAP